MHMLKPTLISIGVALLIAGCGGSSSTDPKTAAATATPDGAQALQTTGQPQALSTSSLALNSYQSFQVTTAGFTNRFLRHRDSLARTDAYDANSSALDRADASFRVVAGLADSSCYSIESQNYPGQFLRHQAWRVRMDKRDGSPLFDADATWCGKPGLSGSGITLESLNLRGSYMRHFNSEVWLAKKGGANGGDAAANFEADASWSVATPWSHSLPLATGSHSLQVTSANLGNRYARHSQSLGYTEVVDGNSASLLKNDATFKIVPGLSDPACYSLESQNYAGSYLRHQNFRVKLAAPDGSDGFRRDATFCAQNGLSGNGVSLEASNMPGFFLRHFNSELWMASGKNARPSDTADRLREDATWNIANPWAANVGPALASIQLAQSQLFNSNDSALVLISNKAVLVKVNATSGDPSVSKPNGSIQVQDANGNVIREIALKTPTGALPASVPSIPDLNTSYSAVIPADLVKTGLRLKAVLSNGQTSTINPRVGGSVPMDLITIPIQIGGSVGHIVSNLGAFVQARIPVSNVNQYGHATYVSTRVTSLPTDDAGWSDAFGKLLGEIADLHTLEGANDRQHYFGFIPKATYGLAGLGYVPGTAGVAADIPSINEEGLRGIVTHELGHNYRLGHAACGGAGSPDPAYPYPNAQLGTGNHYTWGYLFDTNSFFDPRSTEIHDIMSYCGGSTFSDYNTHLMQAFLTPADALMTSAVSDVPQDLVLISGQITAGKASLSPLKSFVGRAKLPAKGEYTLHIVTSQGAVDYPFATLTVDHAETMKSQNFSFSIPNPGAIVSVSVVKGSAALMQSASRPVAQASVSGAVAKPAVQVREQVGSSQVSWDHTQYPYLTVTVVSDSKRYTLAQDLQGGSATLPLSSVPAGGTFEFSLSDGINTMLVKQNRAQ